MASTGNSRHRTSREEGGDVHDSEEEEEEEEDEDEDEDELAAAIAAEEDEDYIPLPDEEPQNLDLFLGFFGPPPPVAASEQTLLPQGPAAAASQRRRRARVAVTAPRTRRRTRWAIREGDEEGDDGGGGGEADEVEIEVLGVRAARGPEAAAEVGGELAESGGAEEGREEASCSGRSSGSETADPSALPNCPICLEKWTCEGVHRVCCTPCGHVYGRSCLQKWIKRCGKGSAKCPQCNRKFRDRQIINLYAPQIAVANDDLEKEVRCLRGKNEALNNEKNLLLEEVHRYKKRILEMERFERQKKATLDHNISGAFRKFSSDPFSEVQRSLLQPFTETTSKSQNNIQGVPLSCCFVLQIESAVDEARALDIDASSQILIISRTLPGFISEHVITKISMLAPNEMEHVQLPANTGAVKDIHIAPSSTVAPGRLALLASLGKKLSVFSMESSNVVLKYDLPGPAWSCSWDLNNPDFVYAGLQNGMLLVFDIRQTARPLRSNSGSSGHPVHTIHSLVSNQAQDSRTLLSASSVGPCLWDGNSLGEWPVLIPEMESHGVCISLACGSSSDEAVASFRPKVDASSDILGSQLSQSRSPMVSGPGKIGDHVLLRRVDNNCFRKCHYTSGSVSEVRMSRSAIISVNGYNPMFVYGDEASRGLCVWDLPSLQVARRLKPHQHPIIDVKYSSYTGSGLLSCISRNKLQVFACSDL